MSELDPNFVKVTDLLMKQAQQARDALRNLQPAFWESFGLKAGADQELAAIAQIFSRITSERNYQRAIEDTGNGTIKELISAKLQSDLLSQAERDFKRRRLRRIRAVTHEAVRRGGHGHEEGPIAQGLQYNPRQILQRDAT